MLRQISLFAENKKGTMHRITAVLAEHGINIIDGMKTMVK